MNKKVLILTSWHLKMPADPDLHFFQKMVRVYTFEFICSNDTYMYKVGYAIVFQMDFMLNIPAVVTVLFRARYHHMEQDIHTQVSPTMLWRNG